MTISSCKKEMNTDIHSPTKEDGINSRSEYEATVLEGDYLYYKDNQAISKELYESQNTSFWFHSVTSESNGQTITECHVFSGKNDYEQWGDQKGIPVAKMNKFDDRVQKIADDLGITGIVSSGQSPSAAMVANFENEIEVAYNQLFQSVLSPVYEGSRFYTNSCDPLSGGCTNSSVFVPAIFPFAQNWLAVGYPWMEDNAEAWAPKLLLPAPSNGYQITFRAWSYPFYVTPWWQNWKKKHTVVVPSGKRSLFVPFIGPIGIWSNRISSWMVFPGV